MVGIKKMTGKWLAVLAVVTALCLSLTGCGKKMAPADQTIGALFELAVKSNTAPMKDLLGFDTDEDVFNAFFEEGSDVALADSLSNAFARADTGMPAESMQELTNAFVNVFNKVSYTAEITSEDKDTTIVTLKVYGIPYDDLNQLSSDAYNKMLSSLTGDDMIAINDGNTEILSSYLAQYARDLIDGLVSIEPTSEAHAITVTCKKLIIQVNDKETVAWLPSDMDGFINEIASAIYAQ